MATLQSGQTISIQLAEGESYTVTPSGTAQVSTRGVSGSELSAPRTLTSAQTFGPYTEGGVINIACLVGTAFYAQAGGAVYQDPTTGALVGGNGSQIAKFIPRYGLGSQWATMKRGVIQQFADGAYLAYDEFPGAGEGSARLARIVGDPLGSGVATVLSQTSALAANALLSASGVLAGNAANSITQAWAISNGDVFFVMVAAGNYHHLYRAKAGTYTVGADASYTNKRACIDIGLNGGTHADQVRSFNQRALLEARVGSATHLFFCEYNTTSGRVSGTGGAGKDQAIVYRSTDGGTTWSTFLEFNTGGSHVIDHFHGAVQDPYTGWIYFLTGDSGSECAVIAYNGTAAAPAANTPLATIAATAGYRVISGNELSRYTDICFDQHGIFSIPDCDTETVEGSTTGFVSTRLPRTLDWVASIAPVARFADIPPCQAYSSSTWGTFMVSFRTESANTASEPYLYVWSANVEEGTWDLIAKVKNFRNVTGVPRGFFVDGIGRMWISGTYKGGLSFDSTLVVSATTSSVCINLGSRGDVQVYDLS